MTECGTDYVMTQVQNNATIGERKNMNLPGIKVELPVLGEKDKNDLINFGKSTSHFKIWNYSITKIST